MVCLLRRYDGTRYPHCGRVVSPCVGNVIVRASTAYFTSPNWASRDPKRGPKPHKWALTRRPRSQPGSRSRFPRFPLLVVQGILRRSADFVLFLLRFVFPEFVRIFAVAGEFGELRHACVHRVVDREGAVVRRGVLPHAAVRRAAADSGTRIGGEGSAKRRRAGNVRVDAVSEGMRGDSEEKRRDRDGGGDAGGARATVASELEAAERVAAQHGRIAAAELAGSPAAARSDGVSASGQGVFGRRSVPLFV